MGLLQGKVALVTGAGGGLGRAHALLLAQEGAAVVVNDLGVARDGSSPGESMAERVVAEIKAAGGRAVANRGSVTDPEAVHGMIQDALEHFGSLDIVINNAGILRDKTLLRMTDDMWDIVQDVHLKGTFLVTRAALKIMRERQIAGRIINTSSYAGLKGNFGQANYGAAKAGIAGFTRVVALEVRRARVTVNCLAPVAKTRMTEDIDVVPDNYAPEDISPLVVWLASEDAQDITGRVFGAHGAHYFEYKVEMTPGVEKEGRWGVAEVGERFEEICRSETVAASSSAEGDEDLTAEVFARMGEAFMPEKASGWSATLHFKLGAERVFTVSVADQNVKTTEGAEGSPSCIIKFASEDVFLGTVMGKVDPQQAFMAGKISSNNLNELMRYTMCFDMKKAAALAAAGSKKDKGPDMVDEAFARMGEAFVPEKAAGWTSVLHFKIGPDRMYTVHIANQEVNTSKGAEGKALCTIKFESEEVFLGTISGKVNPQQAFMAGQISADNMNELMRYTMCFDMKKAAAAAKAKEGEAKAAPSALAGLNKDFVGKKYKISSSFIKPEEALAYAEATDDLNEAYKGDDAIAPMMFAVRPLMKTVEALVMDEELRVDALLLLHGEQDMKFLRPLKPWDLVAPRAEIVSIEDKSSGQVLTARQWLMCEGEKVCEAVGTFFIRAEKSGEKKAKQAAAPAKPVEREVIYEENQVVAADQSLRYANASGDLNPIHTDEGVAKSAGFPSVILHGLCSMAFAGRAVVNGICDGDPKKLKRFNVRFSKPVLPGWTLTTKIWEEEAQDGARRLGLEMTNQDGEVVLTRAFAEVAE